LPVLFGGSLPLSVAPLCIPGVVALGTAGCICEVSPLGDWLCSVLPDSPFGLSDSLPVLPDWLPLMPEDECGCSVHFGLDGSLLHSGDIGMVSDGVPADELVPWEPCSWLMLPLLLPDP
jgi:hypothetical protein